MAEQIFDVVIIGSGPGGYEAAVHAGKLGKSVACIEKAELGGICLNWGCIPTKALLRDAHLFTEITHEAPGYGIGVDASKFDFSKVVTRSRNVAATMSKGIEFLFKKNKVAHFKGTAFVPQPGIVEVTAADGKKTTLQTKNILVCTGARNREIPSLKTDAKNIITAREAMVLKDIPKRLIIIGAGAIGVEFAYIYHAFGSKVTLVEMMPNILPVEDTDVSTTLERIFTKRGIDIRTNSKTEKLEVAGGGGNIVKVTVSKDGKQETLEADKVLVAVGVQGNWEGLFAPAAQPEIFKNHIKTGPDFQTNIKGLYAAGDVIGPPWLAHVATREAKIAIDRMFGRSKEEMDYTLIPGCTYCEPQVASVGLTERACKEQALEYEVGKYNFAASGKAHAINAPDGFVKLIFRKSDGELLGAHMLGAEVTDMLAELVLAKRLECTKNEIMTTIHAHPTLSEVVMEAAQAAH